MLIFFEIFVCTVMWQIQLGLYLPPSSRKKYDIKEISLLSFSLVFTEVGFTFEGPTVVR